LDAGAQEEWKSMIIELMPLELVSKLDKAIFAKYCQAYSTWAQAMEKISEMGMIRKTPNGFYEQNPYFPIANKASEQMLKALIELGMTPSSRSRIKIVPPEKKSAEEDFLKMGRK
jgi:P27 family predicted phage terminase small subunit